MTRSTSSRKDYTEKNLIKTSIFREESFSKVKPISNYVLLNNLHNKKMDSSFFEKRKNISSKKKIYSQNPNVSFDKNKSNKFFDNKNRGKVEQTSYSIISSLNKSSDLYNYQNRLKQEKNIINLRNSEQKSSCINKKYFDKSKFDHLKNDIKNDGKFLLKNSKNKELIQCYNYKNDLNHFLKDNIKYNKIIYNKASADSNKKLNNSTRIYDYLLSEESQKNFVEKEIYSKKFSFLLKNQKVNKNEVFKIKRELDNDNLNIISSNKKEKSINNKLDRNNITFISSYIPFKIDSPNLKKKNKLSELSNECSGIPFAKRKKKIPSFNISCRFKSSNQNKDLKNNFSIGKKKYTKNNFKIFSQNIININYNNNKKKYFLHNSDKNNFLYNNSYNHKILTDKNKKKGQKNLYISYSKNSKNEFSPIENIKLNFYNFNEYSNIQLNSKDYSGINILTNLQTCSNLSTNYPYLDKKCKQNINNTNNFFLNKI